MAAAAVARMAVCEHGGGGGHGGSSGGSHDGVRAASACLHARSSKAMNLALGSWVAAQSCVYQVDVGDITKWQGLSNKSLLLCSQGMGLDAFLSLGVSR